MHGMLEGDGRGEMTNEEILLRALKTAVSIADLARKEWDATPDGMRAGKLLIALAGGCPGYRADIDAIHAAIAAAEVELASRNDSAVDVIANAREVIQPLSWKELYGPPHTGEWTQGFDVAAQAMAIEAERAVNVLACCIEDLASALRDMRDLAAESSQYKGEYLAKKHGDAEEIANCSATLARWGLEK